MMESNLFIKTKVSLHVSWYYNFCVTLACWLQGQRKKSKCDVNHKNMLGARFMSQRILDYLLLLHDAIEDTIHDWRVLVNQECMWLMTFRNRIEKFE